MKEGGVFLSFKDLKRFEVITRCVERLLLNREAATLLNLSERQVRRLKGKVKEMGLKGLIHGNRGREPANKVSKETKDKVIELLKGKYAGFNTLHFQEKLAEEEQINLSPEYIRGIYIEQGISRRKHKRRRRFTLRDRMPQRGLMLQMDTSEHDWFETGQDFALVAAIDDASSEVPYACFFTSDNTINNMAVLKEIIKRKGLFTSLYVDKASHFRTIRQGKGNTVVVKGNSFDDTQIQRALKELGIEMINAHTPQAKGRIERLFELFQDRLLKELRLRGIKDLEQANKFLINYWLPYYNKRFSVKPASEESAYMKLVKGIDLDSILCVKLQRRVALDNTIKLNKRTIEILPDSYRTNFARATVEVRINSKNKMKIYYQGRALKFRGRTKSLWNKADIFPL